MSEFIGGMPGKSFIVKARFESVDAMFEAFKKGPDYTEVWYGEFCIIDTPNKNNPHNGKIYQRGVDYSHVGVHPDYEDLSGTGETQYIHDGGAIYVGQIVGPASGTPWLSVMGLDDVVDVSKSDLNTTYHEERLYPTGGTSVDATTGRKTYNVYRDDNNKNIDPPIGICKFSVEDNSLVPGKQVSPDGTVSYNEDIEFTWVNIRSSDKNNDSTYYVGFKFPYYIAEFDSVSKYPYKNGKYDGSAPCVCDDDSHVFYRHYTFQVPQGVKGDSVSNLRQVVLTGEEKYIYTVDEVTYEGYNGRNGILRVPAESRYEVQRNAGKTVWVYDISVFDHTDSPDFADVGMSGNSLYPDKISIYVADYNEVRNAYMTEDGTIVLVTNNGEKIFIYLCDSNGNPLVDDNGNPIPFKIQSLQDVKLSTDDKLVDDKRIRILFNTDGSAYTPIGDPINYIQEMVVDGSNYHLYVLYNDPEHRLREADISDPSKGVVCLDAVDSYGYPKDLADCDVFMDGDGITWRRRINLSVASEKTRRLLGWDDESQSYPGNDTITTDTFWRDYCSIREYSGILVGMSFTHEQVVDSITSKYPDIEVPPVDPDDPAWHDFATKSVIEWLNAEYGGGLTAENTGDASLTGKIVCIGNDPFDKRMYAYDYRANTWFYLGKTNENDMYDAKLLAKSFNEITVPGPDAANVTVYGLIFLEQPSPVKSEGMPRYWERSFNWDEVDYRWVWHYFYEL